LAETSAAAYGRDAATLAADREALLERIAELSRGSTSSGNGEARDDPDKGALPPPRSSERSQSRRGRGRSRPRRNVRTGDQRTHTNREGAEPPTRPDDGGERTRETDDREADGKP